VEEKKHPLCHRDHHHAFFILYPIPVPLLRDARSPTRPRTKGGKKRGRWLSPPNPEPSFIASVSRIVRCPYPLSEVIKAEEKKEGRRKEKRDDPDLASFCLIPATTARGSPGTAP